ncbi:hypothetical protein [Desulfosarcina ovata]|uniref:Uncharacterized protein n=1 Tax=Desulfosarcina ovata subsp. ovata TaxID=2752305 RepID=A0A5K8AK13_9BACT|nr:hypothetical protein [Desulfosarcina ovata]BBO92140.1 hypothetical protein DSCOOX_53200 [Desulfosarcina ovata subsp. ovata]
MSYKENLLTKIAIDRLVQSIASAIGPVESGKRIDKTQLKQLMTYFPWSHRQERDLELYLENDGTGTTRILVLDNDLTIYRTTVDDVVLRKSPTVKEMVSIRNAIKILNDKDVVVSKKETSLHTIQSICIDRLDLSYTVADIEDIFRQGVASLENGYAEGVAESLMLFAELLGLEPAPRRFALRHHDLYGKVAEKPGGEVTFGPLVIFSRVNHTLACLETALSSRDKGRLDVLKAVAEGEAGAAATGPAVFDLMKAKVLAADPQ